MLRYKRTKQPNLIVAQLEISESEIVKVLPDYDSKMEKAFTQDTMYNLTKMRVSHIEKNENYQKAQKLVEKYDMLKYDEMVKNDTKGHNQIVDYINNYKPEYED